MWRLLHAHAATARGTTGIRTPRCASLPVVERAVCSSAFSRAAAIMDSLTLALFLIVILLAFILVLTVYVCYELRALRSRSGRVLSEASVAHAKRCVFELALSARGGAVGVGVFYAPSEAVTAAHNLNSARRGRVVYGRLHTPGGQVAEPLLIKLEVVSVNVELDFATLRCAPGGAAYPYFLRPYNGPLSALEGENLALCAFQLAIREEHPGFRLGGMSVMSASGCQLSPLQRHLLYSCTTWAGDSGGALLMHDGRLVGIHLEFVNALREELERKTVVEDRLTNVEESLKELVKGAGQGSCVAVLMTEVLRAR